MLQTAASHQDMHILLGLINFRAVLSRFSLHCICGKKISIGLMEIDLSNKVGNTLLDYLVSLFDCLLCSKQRIAGNEQSLLNGPQLEKICLRGLLTTKAHTSLRIRAV